MGVFGISTSTEILTHNVTCSLGPGLVFKRCIAAADGTVGRCAARLRGLDGLDFLILDLRVRDQVSMTNFLLLV